MTEPITDPGPLLTVLDGLVSLHLLRLAQRPDEYQRALAETEADGGLADTIAEAGDRLTSPGNFSSAADRQTRSELLTAMATCLALGALQPGGVTWCGRHWCTAPHTDCPHHPDGGAQ